MRGEKGKRLSQAGSEIEVPDACRPVPTPTKPIPTKYRTKILYQHNNHHHDPILHPVHISPREPYTKQKRDKCLVLRAHHQIPTHTGYRLEGGVSDIKSATQGRVYPIPAAAQGFINEVPVHSGGGLPGSRTGMSPLWGPHTEKRMPTHRDQKDTLKVSKRFFHGSSSKGPCLKIINNNPGTPPSTIPEKTQGIGTSGCSPGVFCPGGGVWASLPPGMPGNTGKTHTPVRTFLAHRSVTRTPGITLGGRARGSGVVVSDSGWGWDADDANTPVFGLRYDGSEEPGEEVEFRGGCVKGYKGYSECVLPFNGYGTGSVPKCDRVYSSGYGTGFVPECNRMYSSGYGTGFVPECDRVYSSGYGTGFVPECNRVYSSGYGTGSVPECDRE
ncbi:hypothetical protein GOBAR_AA16692 [Gossypium barbadense]|uniref:Uncharacterized protein n=1 Tax=Gossypium barbadense TaxID=3634 RepID=A0A2P5XKU0_GOSBA|nr:hypothetical protein GOBAR_AA16692 [Gossypium barbadense]